MTHKQIECPECHFTTGHWSTCSLGHYLKEEAQRVKDKQQQTDGVFAPYPTATGGRLAYEEDAARRAYDRIVDNQQPVEVSDPQFAAGLGKQRSPCPFCGKLPEPRTDYPSPRVSCVTRSCAIFGVAILVTLWEKRAGGENG